MRFHIAGLGAVGSLLAFHLRRSLDIKHQIFLIHRTKQAAIDARYAGGLLSVENDGTTLTATGFQHFALDTFARNPEPKIFRKPLKPGRPPVVTEPPAPARPWDAIDSLFVTTKAHSVVDVVRALSPLLSKKSTIVLLGNGMGVYEHLIHELYQNPYERPNFILGVNTHGAWRKDRWKVVHAGVGRLQFGIVPDSAPAPRDFEKDGLTLDNILNDPSDPDALRYLNLRNTIAALQNAEDLVPTWKPIVDIEIEMQRKVVTNSIINPLTALLGCRNGDVFELESGLRIMRAICAEAEAVFAPQFYAETRGPSGPLEAKQKTIDDWLRDGFSPDLTRRALERLCLQVARGTANNFSSMLVDMRNGAPTEIEYTNGYLMNLGVTYDVPMPATAMLLNLIKLRSAIPDQSRL